MLRHSKKLFRPVSRCGLRGLSSLSQGINDCDPEIQDLIEREKRRQRGSLALIPSENFTSNAVLEGLGSVMANKYSEGYPGARYYGGNEFIDQAETLCQKRALELYDLDPEEWGVNVQPLSGTPANFYTYNALLGPHDRFMALDLPHGGHLSHGYQAPNKKISATSKYFECLPYRLNEATGYIDYDKLEENALLYRPKLIVMGATAYPRHIEYDRFRSIANKINAYLMTDMAHISGLVASKAMPSPFPFSDVVTTTTHKSLRGPRGAMIFYRKGVRSVSKKGKETLWTLDTDINESVFPGMQGGPHNHTITALAIALKQANTKEFQDYGAQVLKNNARLAEYFLAQGVSMVSGGTDNHLMILDCRPLGTDGAKAERVCELANIAVNKNTVPGDVSALKPGGLRLGAPALTSRNLKEADFEKVGQFVKRAIDIAVTITADVGGPKSTLPKFMKQLKSKDYGIEALGKEVEGFMYEFEPIGFDVNTMKYPDAN